MWHHWKYTGKQTLHLCSLSNASISQNECETRILMESFFFFSVKQNDVIVSNLKAEISTYQGQISQIQSELDSQKAKNDVRIFGWFSILGIVFPLIVWSFGCESRCTKLLTNNLIHGWCEIYKLSERKKLDEYELICAIKRNNFWKNLFSLPLQDLRGKNWKAMEALSNTEQSYQKLLKQSQNQNVSLRAFKSTS